MSAHTPGPWKLIRFPNGPRVLSDGGYHVATVIDFNAFAVNKGNARLIAAAPELLAALKDVVWRAASEVSHCAGRKCRESHCADCMGEESAERYIAEVALSVEAARAAIAKAEGRA